MSVRLFRKLCVIFEYELHYNNNVADNTVLSQSNFLNNDLICKLNSSRYSQTAEYVTTSLYCILDLQYLISYPLTFDPHDASEEFKIKNNDQVFFNYRQRVLVLHLGCRL